MMNPITWNFPDSPSVESKELKSKEVKVKSVDVDKVQLQYPPAVIDTNSNKRKKDEDSKYYTVDLLREPMVTFCITPNNAPENIYSYKGRNARDFELPSKSKIKSETDLLLTTIHGLYNNFYLPERIRFNKNGFNIKMNDIVSFKILMSNGELKFYISVPEKWKRSFVSAIRQDWGNVDLSEVDNEIVIFDESKTKAMDLHLRHHYALSLKHSETTKDSLMSSLSSLASTLDKGDKVLIDYNIEPVDSKWKGKSHLKLTQFKEGKVPSREDTFTFKGAVGKVFDVLSLVIDEFSLLIEQVMGVSKEKEERREQLFKLNYSEPKINPNTKGYKVQIRVLGESKEDKKVNYAFKNIETAYSLLDGDNKFTSTQIKSKKGVKNTIKAVTNNQPILNKTTDVFFEKELKNLIKLPDKETLKEFEATIMQDTYTRSKIDESFYDEKDGAIPFGYTLDKEPKKVYLGGYEREDWNDKGRKAKNKQALDDSCVSTITFGGQGGGKTSYTENQILHQFATHITDKELWKKMSKSAIAMDVADGAMIKNIYERVPEWLKDRVIILNHCNFNNPIAVNNSDLAEYNTEIMKDDDYSYTLAEMEAKLVLEILGSENTISMDRWFTSSLQVVHLLDKDWGYIEAMRVLIDADFREQLLPQLKVKNRRLHLELKSYHEMASQGKVAKIIETIQNRFSQLERDQKLWDCIAQKPLRNENGKVKLNFRQLMDGDEDGAYLVLIYIPKTGVSQLYRKFIFAHYFTKIWNVAMSREYGFADREYRPETLVAIDEIHQIIDIPLVARLFIDIFKEPRKYSLRYLFTLHGWSSLAKAGRGLEGDIKQSIMDNGCNLVMLRGGQEAFQSLENFLHPITLADFNNLMHMDYCGIFSFKKNNKTHVMQAKLLEPISDKKSVFKKYGSYDSKFLFEYNSPYGVDKDTVRDDNLDRSFKIIEDSLKNSLMNVGEDEWSELEKVGMKEKN